MSSVTFYEPLYSAPAPQRNGFFVDDAGSVSRVKGLDDDVAIAWNLTDFLATSEAVSSAAYEDHGVTTSSTSVSSPSVLFTVTGTGWTKVTATLSSGRTYERIFMFYDKTGPRAQDYR